MFNTFGYLFIAASLAFSAIAVRYQLNTQDINRLATVPKIEVNGNAEVITDNVKAYEKRLEMIRSATKTLDLAYYIYSDDESSSVLSKELINAANRGVKVRVLLDYITNYSNLDLFLAMQNAVDSNSGGSLEFRFFGRPSPNIIKDAIYMTTPCSPENQVGGRETYCTAEKKPIADKIQAMKGMAAYNYNSGFSGILLSGFYSKSSNASNYALTVGGKFNPDEMQSDGEPMTDEQKRGLVDLVKLYKEAKFGSVLSAIKLQAAMLFYGDEVRGLVAFMDKTLPTGQESYNELRGDDWEHITDFLHHKLLLSDKSKILIGGRNIENSYHMENNPSGKYVFMDTDVYLDVKSTSGKALQASFDDLWNFEVMVATTNDILQHAPNDYQVELDLCVAEKKSEEVCFQEVPGKLKTSEQILQSRRKRQAQELNILSTKAKSFSIPNSAGNPVFKIDQGANISYLENLPFTKSKRSARIYGAKLNKEAESGKNIHAIWTKAMLNTCTGKEKKNIYLHQAYFLPPANLMQALGEMTKTARVTRFDVDYRNLDCSNVTIKVVTNSIPTTDLSIINVMARHQMHELFKAIEKSNDKEKAAKLEYYEYVKPNGVIKSLHSKVSILGDVAIIGSANADVRSYMMDTNNAFLIANAPSFIEAYSGYLEAIIADRGTTTRLDLEWRNYKEYEANNYAKLNQESLDQIDEMARVATEGGKTWPTADRIDMMKNMTLGTVGDVRAKTATILSIVTQLEEDLRLQLEKSRNHAAERYLRDIERTTNDAIDFDKMYKTL